MKENRSTAGMNENVRITRWILPCNKNGSSYPVRCVGDDTTIIINFLATTTTGVGRFFQLTADV